MVTVLRGESDQGFDATAALSAERQRQLEAILDYSHEMLALARKRQWDALAEIELTRQALLFDLCSGTVLSAEAHQVALVIREVLDIDSQVIDHVEAAREGVLQGLQQVNTGRRAQLAYTESLR